MAGSHTDERDGRSGAPEPSADAPEDRRPASFSARVRSLVRAIEENDEAKVEEAILRLSRSRRVFAPLAFAISAFVMLFDGLRLLVSNWRLTLVQILPAMWIWLAMFDLKAHTLHGNSFNVLRGPVLIPIGLVIVTLTVASYFLNAVFAFAISQPGRVEIRPAVAQSAPALGADPAVRSRHGRAARVLDHRRDPLGTPLVHALAGHHRRRDDGQLRGRARAADRGSEAQTVNARQAVNQRGRRGAERDRVHAALPPRTTGDPDARIQLPGSSPGSSCSPWESRCKPAPPGRSGRSR